MTEVFQKSASTRQSQVRLRELETAANTYRSIYETFLSRFTQSVQQQSFPSTEARVVTVASAPRRAKFRAKDQPDAGAGDSSADLASGSWRRSPVSR